MPVTTPVPSSASPAANAAFDGLKLAAARLRAAERQPFLAVALYALVPVAAPGLGTFAVDERWRLSIDPATLDQWPIDVVTVALLHEVGHVVRDHAGRARDEGVDEETKDRWNIAGDVEINEALTLDGCDVPETWCSAAMLRLPAGRAAEFYFRELRRDPRLPPAFGCGSGAHGVEPRRDGDGDGEGVTGIERDLIRAEVARSIRAGVSSRPDSIAGSWVRWADACLDPQLDWRQLLRAAVRQGVAVTSGATDYTYQRLSRRRQPNVVLPATARSVPAAAMVIDTSGSVGDAELSLAATEVHGCLRHLGVRRDLLSVWATDTVAQRVPTSVFASGRRARLTGGGGTDMGTGIETALASRPRPGLVVVITDGHTPWPARAPTARVVVALLPSPLVPDPPPAWATVVRVMPRSDAT